MLACKKVFHKYPEGLIGNTVWYVDSTLLFYTSSSNGSGNLTLLMFLPMFLMQVFVVILFEDVTAILI